MPCPEHDQPQGCDPVGQAIARCPFLLNVASSLGDSFARQVATKPHMRATPAACRRPLLEEDYTDFESTIRLFHGPGGVVPLKKFESEARDVVSGCPVARGVGLHRAAAPAGEQSKQAGEDIGTHVHAPPTALFNADGRPPVRRCARAGGSFAAISLSGSFGPLPGPDDVLRFLGKKPQRPRPRPSKTNKNSGPAPSSSSSSTDRVTNPHRPPSSKLSHSSSSSTSRGPAGTTPAGGRCPMRKFIEPLGGLLPLGSAMLRKLQGMECPRAIIAARAAVARTEAVRQLRPQALHVKMMAIGTFAALLNVPFGVWRAHTDKFSPAWFVAVHTPIPFIAILRKAVLMPKWAMALTFTAAVLGQAAGARIERQRLAGPSVDGAEAPGAAAHVQAPLPGSQWAPTCTLAAVPGASGQGSKVASSMAPGCALEDLHRQLPLGATFLHSLLHNSPAVMVPSG